MAAGADSGRSDQYVVVARRYRPQDFQQLVGQDQVSQALANAIETGRVGHAYLFTGARGVGKTSSARIFAKALNCTRGPTPTPCNQCDICQAIAAGEDVDVLEIDGASNRGIDEIRQLRSNIGVRPSRSKYRIYIIDEVHMLTTAAFNALLKTLEEPPEHVKFIFCTTDPEKIPITVLSRCQRFDFAPVATGAIAQRLREIVEAEGAEADEDALALVARRAGGSMRDSQSLLEQLLAFGGRRITVDDIHAMLGTAHSGRIFSLADCLRRRDAAAALGEIAAAAVEGVDHGQMCEQLLGYYRDLMVAAVGGAGELLLYAPPQDLPQLAELGRELGIQSLLAIAQILDQALVRMRSSTQIRTLLEMAVVRICQLEQLDDLAGLIRAARDGVPPAASLPNASRGSAPGAAVAPGESPPASGSQKKTEQPRQSEQSSPSAPPPEEVSGQPLTANSADQVWRQSLDLLEDMTAGLARLASRTATIGPNQLAVTFPARYNLQKESCERPDRKVKLEEALARVAGHPVQLQFHLEQESGGGAPRPSSQPRSRRQVLRDAERDPAVAEAVKVFGAEVVRVDPLPNSED